MRRLALLATTLTLVLGCNPPRVAAGPTPAPTEAARDLPPQASPEASCAPTTSSAYVLVGERRLPVDLALTPEARVKGLSGRPCLARGTGLVLGWERPTEARIWMPDMRFAIDVVFVRAERVVAIYPDAQPCVEGQPCPTFGPAEPVDYVLEVPAGTCAELGVVVGAAISLVE
ncbi:MAG: DUF192 domain-containing protein [Candidatus Sericytochromatia bacterium]|nr:DUF192 domain-containing protein [Candidatus Sericytochromatia bacterium]